MNALCYYIANSAYAELFFKQPHDPWESDQLLSDVLWINWNKWVAASTHAIPGCGVVVRQDTSMSVKIWLQILFNQYPDRLKLVGRVLQYNRQETGTILAAIQRAGLSGMFGFETVELPMQTVELPMATHETPLMNLLNPTLVGPNDTAHDKILMIESALSDPSINKVVQEKLPQLFPGSITLLNLAKQGPLWETLCAGLVVFVEREHLKRKETFNIGDLRSYIQTAAERLFNDLRVIDLLRHNPAQSAEERKTDWRTKVAARVFNKPTLLNLLGKQAELIYRHSTQEEMDRWIEQLLALADQNPAVRQQVLGYGRDDGMCIAEAVNNIAKDLFPSTLRPVDNLQFSCNDLYTALLEQKIPEDMVKKLLESEIDTVGLFLDINDFDLKSLFPDVPQGKIIKLRAAQRALRK